MMGRPYSQDSCCTNISYSVAHADVFVEPLNAGDILRLTVLITDVLALFKLQCLKAQAGLLLRQTCCW